MYTYTLYNATDDCIYCKLETEQHSDPNHSSNNEWNDDSNPKNATRIPFMILTRGPMRQNHAFLPKHDRPPAQKTKICSIVNVNPTHFSCKDACMTIDSSDIIIITCIELESYEVMINFQKYLFNISPTSHLSPASQEPAHTHLLYALPFRQDQVCPGPRRPHLEQTLISTVVEQIIEMHQQQPHHDSLPQPLFQSWSRPAPQKDISILIHSTREQPANPQRSEEIHMTQRHRLKCAMTNITCQEKQSAAAGNVH